MELAYLVFNGALAASLASLLNVLMTHAVTRLRGRSPESWRQQTFASQLGVLAIHLCVGAGLGLLFWLSWGMAAVVGVPWWLRGILFALIVWIVICVPMLVVQFIAVRTHWSVSVATAIDWLMTLMIVGIACGWAWQRGV